VEFGVDFCAVCSQEFSRPDPNFCEFSYSIN
jgi:hypothetical protein